MNKAKKEGHFQIHDHFLTVKFKFIIPCEKNYAGLFVLPKNKNQHSDSLDQILVFFFSAKGKGHTLYKVPLEDH